MTFSTLVSRPYFCLYQDENMEQRSTYFNNLEHDQITSSQYSHYFCGEHNVKGAWCPNCSKPLLRLLRLDTNDSRLAFQSSVLNTISLFYCWTCNIAQDYFSYQIKADDQIVIINYGKGGCEVDFPYEIYPTFFSGAPAYLVEIKNEAQEMIADLNHDRINYSAVYGKYPELTEARHQIGGEPLLMQRNPDYQDNDEQELRCPRCGENMPFLASIGNDCLDPRGISGNDYAQILFHFCLNCRVMGSFQQTD